MASEFPERRHIYARQALGLCDEWGNRGQEEPLVHMYRGMILREHHDVTTNPSALVLDPMKESAPVTEAAYHEFEAATRKFHQEAMGTLAECWIPGNYPYGELPKLMPLENNLFDYGLRLLAPITVGLHTT